jgi:site-specific DNA recombinase
MGFVRNPDNGRRVSRPKSDMQLIARHVPELRIVDQALWDQVQARLREIREATGADNADRPRYWEGRRARHMLTGKLFCGSCGGAMTNIGRNYLACSAARRQGSTCSNKRGIRRDALDNLILDSLQTRLMHPEHVATFIAEFTAEWNRLLAETSAHEHARRRELETVSRKLAGLIDAIADGLRATGLQQKLDDLEARKAELEHVLQGAPPPKLRLHPNLAAVYRRKVATLQKAMAGSDSAGALETVRSLIERVVLHPAPDGHRGFEIELVGEIAAMMALGIDDDTRGRNHAAGHDLFRSSIKVVAGAGFEPAAFRL